MQHLFPKGASEPERRSVGRESCAEEVAGASRAVWESGVLVILLCAPARAPLVRPCLAGLCRRL